MNGIFIVPKKLSNKSVFFLSTFRLVHHYYLLYRCIKKDIYEYQWSYRIYVAERRTLLRMIKDKYEHKSLDYT